MNLTDGNETDFRFVTPIQYSWPSYLTPRRKKKSSILNTYLHMYKNIKRKGEILTKLHFSVTTLLTDSLVFIIFRLLLVCIRLSSIHATRKAYYKITCCVIKCSEFGLLLYSLFYIIYSCRCWFEKIIFMRVCILRNFRDIYYTTIYVYTYI